MADEMEECAFTQDGSRDTDIEEIVCPYCGCKGKKQDGMT